MIARWRAGFATIALGASIFAGASPLRADEVAPDAARLPEQFSFAREIGRILTQRGCNATHCHGSVKGQKGFKLSAGALYPRNDYEWIVEGGIYQVLTTEQATPRKPRIDRQQPEASLLLLKATGSVPHDGGERIAAGSADYQAIVNWIASGALYGEEPRPSRLEIAPRQVVVEATDRQQLLVTAIDGDGRREDMTDKVLYVSNNEEVAHVSAAGLIEPARPGETAIIVRAAGQSAVVSVAVVTTAAVDQPALDWKSANFIDDHVIAKLRRLRILPAPLSTDEEFLRRVCLDLTGTLPPAERVRAFVADAATDKRDTLIETLFASPQYVDFWTYRFADLFRVNHTSLQRAKCTHAHLDWVRLSIAANKPYDQIARERIAAQGYGGPTSHVFRVGDFILPQEIMAEEMRVFAGVRMECAQCHDHPLESWSQNQFWGLTAFFGQLTVQGSDNDGLLIDFPAGEAGRKYPNVMLHPRTKAAVRPAFLEGDEPSAADSTEPRMAFARWLTAPDNPFFARAAANRIWGYLFGRGIVEPVDDFRSTNPATHPDLLDELAMQFQEHHYDLQYLLRTIVQSRTYQLSGDANATNRTDEINYSRSRPRPLDAVVLLDAISRVTGVEENFVWHSFVGGGETAKGTRAVDLVPEIAPCRFLDAFGRSNRQALPERNTQPNLAQALHMLAGSTYTDKISQKGGRVDLLVERAATNHEAMDELYLTALGRLPTAQERGELDTLIHAQPTRRDALESLVWALISSREFAFNH
jgi:hypothetical protein